VENRYTMLEAARQLGLKSKMTLYHWERDEKIPLPKRFARTNHRFYTDEDIATIKKIMRVGEIIEPPSRPLKPALLAPRLIRTAKRRSRAA